MASARPSAFHHRDVILSERGPECTRGPAKRGRFGGGERRIRVSQAKRPSPKTPFMYKNTLVTWYTCQEKSTTSSKSSASKPVFASKNACSKSLKPSPNKKTSPSAIFSRASSSTRLKAKLPSLRKR